MFPCNVAHDGMSLQRTASRFLTLYHYHIITIITIIYVHHHHHHHHHLSELDVTVDEVGQVGEVEAKRELVVEPARFVKIRS